MSTKFIKTINVIKYNYKNSQQRSTKLVVEFNVNSNIKSIQNLYYYNKYGHKKHIQNVIGLIYGTHTTTYNNVKECIPWLCCSLLLQTRTYDLQFSKYYELIWFMYYMEYIFPSTILLSTPFRFMKFCYKTPKHIIETYREYYLRFLYTKSLQDAENIFLTSSINSHTCPICFEDTKDNVRLNKCYHVFCRSCIKQYIATKFQTTKNIPCPLCRHIHRIHP